MSTTHTERKVIFLMRQGWVPDDVDGHGEIKSRLDEDGLVVLTWTEYRRGVATSRVGWTGLTLDEYVEAVAQS